MPIFYLLKGDYNTLNRKAPRRICTKTFSIVLSRVAGFVAQLPDVGRFEVTRKRVQGARFQGPNTIDIIVFGPPWTVRGLRDPESYRGQKGMYSAEIIVQGFWVI